MNAEELTTAVAGSLEIKTDMGRAIIPIAFECINLFDRKQQDYGSSNIAMSGDLGVAVRLTDKVCRLQHLLRKRIKNEGDAAVELQNESIEDTFMDTANYGLIGMMLERGIWK